MNHTPKVYRLLVGSMLALFLIFGFAMSATALSSRSHDCGPGGVNAGPGVIVSPGCVQGPGDLRVTPGCVQSNGMAIGPNCPQNRPSNLNVDQNCVQIGGASVSIGPGIQANAGSVVVGPSGVQVSPGSVVGPGVNIGPGSVSIGPGGSVTIGSNCVQIGTSSASGCSPVCP